MQLNETHAEADITAAKTVAGAKKTKENSKTLAKKDDKLLEKSLDETKVVESESTKPKSSKITDKAGTEKSVIERSLADNKANSTSGNSTEKHTMALGNAGAFS